jgi:hypothetical protein
MAAPVFRICCGFFAEIDTKTTSALVARVSIA